MRRSFVRSGARVALGAVALVALVAATPAPAILDGYQITMRMTMTEPGAAAPTGPIDMVIKSSADRMRMEMDFGKLMAGRGGEGAEMAGTMMAGMFMLLQPDGKVVTIMPGMNMGMIMDPGAMLSGGGMGGMGGTGISIDTDTAGMSVTVQDLGAGERILGFATRKYHVEMKYKTTVRVMGTVDTTSVNMSTDTWITTDAGEPLAVLRKHAEKFGSMFNGGATKSVTDVMTAKLPKNGVALRTNIKSVDEKGTHLVSVEVAEMKRANFEVTEFEVPAGINVMDLGAMMGGMRGGRGRGGN